MRKFNFNKNPYLNFGKNPYLNFGKNPYLNEKTQILLNMGFLRSNKTSPASEDSFINKCITRDAENFRRRLFSNSLSSQLKNSIFLGKHTRDYQSQYLNRLSSNKKLKRDTLCHASSEDAQNASLSKQEHIGEIISKDVVLQHHRENNKFTHAT